MEADFDDDPLFGDVEETTRVTSQSSAAQLSNVEAQARRLAQYATNLRDNVAAGWLNFVLNSAFGDKVEPDAFLVYRDVLLKDAGHPTDPIERMLIEQLALAHFSIGQLRMRACSTEMPKMTIAFSDAATRLFGEFRRSVLALEEYRTKRAVRTEKSYRNNDMPPLPPTKANDHAHPRIRPHGNRHDTEVASKRKQRKVAAIDEPHMNGGMPNGSRTDSRTQPQSSSSRPQEPPQAKRIDGGWATTAANCGASTSTVAARYWSAHSSRQGASRAERQAAASRRCLGARSAAKPCRVEQRDRSTCGISPYPASRRFSGVNPLRTTFTTPSLRER